MRPVPTDLVAYRRARRVARVATLVVVLVVVDLTIATVQQLVGPGGVNPFGTLSFLLLAGAVAGGFVVLSRLWRRSYRLRPVTLSTSPTVGELYGMPELDAPPRPHRGLNGQDPPPSRW
ncbi:hypothetical protein N866_14975 [Actinotalea ferrariae CF5-4]|uniref:Uncharacterized protein n=1 Tax=Actinotalea ferrariae CF5-4 TaxID=948458 RepID=A0A021VYL0_9CELL|nr:hypothetical protein N866_14975 [Actinotalea ferrariae CF5-4]